MYVSGINNITTPISVSIPKYKYSYDCITTRIIVSIPLYKYKYNCMYSCLIIVSIFICKHLTEISKR